MLLCLEGNNVFVFQAASTQELPAASTGSTTYQDPNFVSQNTDGDWF